MGNGQGLAACSKGWMSRSPGSDIEGLSCYRRLIVSRPELSIVIPAYNEDLRLPPTLDAVASWLDEVGLDGEILVVDDGSSDDTCGLVERRAAAEPRLRLVRNGQNRGKGYSVAHGVELADGELILFSDADLSTPIEEFTKLRRALDDPRVDIAIGSRAMAKSDLQKRQPVYRELMGRTFNLFVQALVFPGIRDTQCGFKLFRRRAARQVFANRRIDGFAFDVELLYVARRLDLEIAEIPVVWVNEEDSRVSPIRHSLEMFRDISRIRWMHRKL